MTQTLDRDVPMRRSRWGRRWMAVPLLAIVIAAGACSDDTSSGDASATTTAPSDSGEQTDFAGTVDIGDGRSLYMDCRGSGSPTVVLVTGLGERADNWMMTTADPTSDEGSVFPAIAESTRVCAYDRPGTRTETETGVEESRSTPLPSSATVAESAEDLDAMLAASGESGPYVLVGHSLGGPIIRLYAAAHPDEVAGLVFDDALSENLAEDFTPAQKADYAILNSPESQGKPLTGERDLFEEQVIPSMNALPPPPEVPTVVLTADTWLATDEAIDSGVFPDFFTKEFSHALWASQLAAQDKLAAKFPWAEHITQTGGAHYIHNDNPPIVIDAIRNVVEQVRAEPPG